MTNKRARLYENPIIFPIAVIALYIVLAIVALYGLVIVGLTPEQANSWASVGMNVIVSIVCSYALFKLFGKRFLIESNFITAETEKSRSRIMIGLVIAFIFTVLAAQIASVGYTALTSNSPFISFGQIELTPFYIILTIIIAPTAEELIFRGIVFGRLASTKLPTLAAALISTLVFAGLHGGTPSKFLMTFALGFFLCMLYKRTGNLLLCMGAHSLNNIIAIPLSSQTVPEFLLNGSVDIAFWIITILVLAWMMARKPEEKSLCKETPKKNGRPHKKDTATQQLKNQKHKQRKKK